MKKITGITLATLGVLGVAGAIKYAKLAIQIPKNNNAVYPGPGEPYRDPYYKLLSQSMLDAVLLVKSKTASPKMKLEAAELLKEWLLECLTIKELDELTEMYRDKPSSIIIGYDPVAVSKFITKFHREAHFGSLKPRTERREFFKFEASNTNVENTKCEDDVNAKYSKIAEELYRDCTIFMSGFHPAKVRLQAAENIKNQLTELLDDEVISDLVDIYREHTEDNLIRFEAHSVSEFIFALRKRYGNKLFHGLLS